MKNIFKIIIPLALLIVLFRFFCGIFIIQPIGAIPEGVTIVYFRNGLNLPFITSIDGILQQSGEGVSLLARGVLLGKLSDPLLEKEIFRFGYSETLYLWSTSGETY